MVKNFQPPHIARIENVQEVLLFGFADLDFWRARLKSENLLPYDADGAAQILISATRFIWSGLPVRELVISLAVCQHAGENVPSAVYLIQAFNSSRVLAFAERAFFQTPYAWGRTEMDTSIPTSIRFEDGMGAMFRAQMANAPARLRGADELLEGAIYLPHSNNVFYARLGGYTEAYPVAAGTDTIEMRASHRTRVFDWLAESRFAPREWRIRKNATHARSKTYARADLV